MANNVEEQLSALVDGEIAERDLERLLQRMGSQPELKQRWARHNLISDALHKNLPRRLDHDLHARVTAALQNEPVILSPHRRQHRIYPWIKQTAGVAIAASVTAVAILGFQSLHQPGADPGAITVAETTAPAADVVDKNLEPYLLNHNEHAVTAGMNGVLPYVRLVSHGDAE